MHTFYPLINMRAIFIKILQLQSLHVANNRVLKEICTESK